MRSLQRICKPSMRGGWHCQSSCAIVLCNGRSFAPNSSCSTTTCSGTCSFVAILLRVHITSDDHREPSCNGPRFEPHLTFPSYCEANEPLKLVLEHFPALTISAHTVHNFRLPSRLLTGSNLALPLLMQILEEIRMMSARKVLARAQREWQHRRSSTKVANTFTLLLLSVGYQFRRYPLR